jgi:hypothetical protein
MRAENLLHYQPPDEEFSIMIVSELNAAGQMDRYYSTVASADQAAS